MFFVKQTFLERKAGNALQELENQLANTAHVKRDSNWQDIPARELVSRLHKSHVPMHLCCSRLCLFL